MSTHRNLRVADSIRRELNELLLYNVRDPRLNSISIQHVDVSPDLRLARIYYTKLNRDLDDEDIEKAFESAKGYFRKQISKNVKLKYTPDLAFFRDQTQEFSEKIDSILNEIKSDDEE